MSLLSVILPCKTQPNPKLFQDLQQQIPQPCELLIQREEGISNAVWHGVNRACGQIIAVMDGDGTHRVQDLVKMLGLLRFYEADLAIGVRVHYTYPLIRRVISQVTNLIARIFLGLRTRDPMSAIYVGHRNAMQFKNVKSCKFGLELQLHAKRPIEVDITPEPQQGHKSHLKPLEGLYLIWQLVRLKHEKN